MIDSDALKWFMLFTIRNKTLFLIMAYYSYHWYPGFASEWGLAYLKLICAQSPDKSRDAGIQHYILPNSNACSVDTSQTALYPLYGTF